jgi:hypothetical protein
LAGLFDQLAFEFGREVTAFVEQGSVRLQKIRPYAFFLPLLLHIQALQGPSKVADSPLSGVFKFPVPVLTMGKLTL